MKMESRISREQNNSCKIMSTNFQQLFCVQELHVKIHPIISHLPGKAQTMLYSIRTSVSLLLINVVSDSGRYCCTPTGAKTILLSLALARQHVPRLHLVQQGEKHRVVELPIMSRFVLQCMKLPIGYHDFCTRFHDLTVTMCLV